MLERSNMGRLLAFLALLFLGTATFAHADDSADAAALAYDVHTEHCADVAAAATSTKTAEQTALVTDAWSTLIRVYETSGRTYLLYWRGLLAQCLGQEERGAEDLQLFVALEQHDQRFSSLVKDAKRRLRRMKITVSEPTEETRLAAREARDAGGEWSLAKDSAALKAARAYPPVPLLLIAGGGGYQRLGRYDYAVASFDLSLRLKGPLRIEAGVRPGWSLSWTNADGTTEPTARFLLFDIVVGPVLEFAGPVRPRVGGIFHIAPNPAGVGGPEVLAGGALVLGVEVPLGSKSVAFRAGGEIGNLGPMFNARLTGSLVVGIEPRGR
jgi:hypothetical protein